MRTNNHFQLIYRVLLIVLLSSASGWTIARGYSVGAILFFIFLIILIIINLIYYLNSTNRKISYFLNSVQNDDSALSFPDGNSKGPVLEIYMGLEKVNKQIQKLKIESRQQEQYFQTLLEHVATGIVTFNSKGFVLHANTAAKKMLGVNVLTHLNQLEKVNMNLFQSIRNIKPFEQKLVSVATTRGTIQLSLKASSFTIKDSILTILSVQDIRNELDEKELDSWMKLIRVLMHEIMNSIAPITSLSQSLSNLFTIDGHEVLPREIDEKTIRTTVRGLNVIGEQGNGLIQFVETYRKLTRLPKPEKKLFKVEDLINRIKVLYTSLENSDRVKLTVVINPPEMELFADENLISQVLLNLLKNANESIKTNEKEGSIRILVDVTANNRPEICVSDNGPGIPPEIMEQIFVPFFTTRESGSGIGLSLSRQIMRLHGGSLQVKSVPDKETTFYMIF